MLDIDIDYRYCWLDKWNGR